MNAARPFRALAALAAGLVLLSSTAGCRSTYYAVWEKLGKQKRHLLRDKVEGAQEAQEEAAEQFRSALERIKELTQFEGGELESVYNRLQTEYERSETRAETVRERIEAVNQVAEDLFQEWEDEIESMSNARLRARSRQKLQETRDRFAQMRASMNKAASAMEPVLTQLRDHVLYLKHNLNARAVGALRTELEDIEREIQSLIGTMNQSIQEAESFMRTLPE